MGRVVVVATAGAGGDLPPLAGAAVALRDRGHHVSFVGDGTVDRSLRPLGLAGTVLPPEVDLGPALIGAIKDAMAETEGDLAAAGPLVQERMTVWAREAAEPVASALGEMRPDVVLTSLFGVEVLGVVAPACPWVVVNSTFYIGPRPPRPMEDDWGPRAIPLIARYATLIDAADLVLHASDQIFDLGFDELPQATTTSVRSAPGSLRANSPPTSTSRGTRGCSSRSAPSSRTISLSPKPRSAL